MLNITKISNKEDAFLISYWATNKNEILLISGNNIVKELNNAFAIIDKANNEQRQKELAYQSQYATGTLGGNYPISTGNSEVKMADAA